MLFLWFLTIIKYLLSCLNTMSENSWIENSKRVFRVAFILLLAGIAYCIFLFVCTKIWNKEIESLRNEVSQLQQKNRAFFDSPDFEKFAFVKQMEEENVQIPWSEHIAAVSQIFDSIEDVEGDSYNIKLSDFKISLDSIGLRWFVTNLKILYNVPENASKASLIQRFQDLWFLHDIGIQMYDKASWWIWFDFVLTAKVENNYDK